MVRRLTNDKKGNHAVMKWVPFGEKVMFKKLRETGQKKSTLDSDWEEGL